MKDTEERCVCLRLFTLWDETQAASLMVEGKLQGC